jgi:hypothetical protein
MISKLKILVALSALVATPAIALAQTAGQQPAVSQTPVAFCCQQENGSGTGTGCTAVTEGAAGLQNCSYVYLDCGNNSFECDPPQATASAKAAVTAANTHNCSCNGGPF